MREILTSRERVKRAINHEEPDRVPIDIGGTKVTGIHVDEYIEVGKYLGIDLELPRVYDQRQMLARVDPLMMDWFHSDVIQLENPTESWNLLENRDWKVWKTTRGNRVLMPGGFDPVVGADGYIRILDGKGTPIAFMPPTGMYFDNDCPTEGTMGDFTFMDPEKWKRSLPLYSQEELRHLEDQARFLHRNTEYSVHGGFLRGSLGRTALFAGHTISDWLCILISEQKYAHEILHSTAERAIENLELYLQAVGPYIDTILVSGSDFGTQNCEIFNPEVFRELHMPNYRIINEYIHAHSHAKTMFHCCGSIWNIIEYFIECGVDILNPVHTNTKNMEPRKLVERYGKRIVFWGGGVETQTVLPDGSPEEVAAQAAERIRIFGPGGGFIFAAVHNIQYGVPPRNIEAIIRTVLERGEYPIGRNTGGEA